MDDSSNSIITIGVQNPSTPSSGESATNRWRKPPPRIKYNAEWTPVRQVLLSRWLPINDDLDGDEFVQKLCDHYWVGDAQMDDVVTMFREMPTGGGRELFEQALERGIESLDNPPAALVALFKQLDHVPSWIEWSMVEQGAVVAANATPLGKAATLLLNAILTTQNGMVGGATGSTGRFQRDVVHRFLESATFWRHLPQPKSLLRFGAGFKNAVRVRLMHAQVRAVLTRKLGDDWIAQNGVPISNTDVVLGVPNFGIANVIYDEHFGVKYSRSDLEAIHMFWTYIGYVMGCSETILPRTPEEGLKIMNFVIGTTAPPSQYAADMNAASNFLLNTMIESGKFPVMEKLLKRLSKEALNGLFFYVGGKALGRRVTETEGPTWAGRITPSVLKLVGRFTGIVRKLSRQRRRWLQNSADGDPFWNSLYERIAILAAQQKEARPVTFAGHDSTKVEHLKDAFNR